MIEGSQMTDDQISTHAQLFDLTGKDALVTGGTRGIGLMMARGLLQAGARVVISSRKADACADAQDQLAQFGDIRAIPADLSRHEECIRLADLVTADTDGLHILVNNAGATWGEPLESFPDSAWRQGSRSQPEVAVLACPSAVTGSATNRYGR